MHLKFAIRNIRKRPSLNAIKILGLGLSLSGILLMALYLKHELTYDHFHDHSERIYRFTVANKISGQHFARVYRPAYIPEFADYAAGIEDYVRLVPVRGGVLKHGEKHISIGQAFQCDSTFFDLFGAELLVGNPKNILDKPGSMVVSESFARKSFGEEDPTGKTVTLPSGQHYSQKTTFTVRGVMKDFPQNSHLHPDFVASPASKQAFHGWAWTYFLLSPNTNPTDIEAHYDDYMVSVAGKKAAESQEAYLQNISEIHLHSHKLREIEPNSNVSVIYSFFAAALVLLAISLINYANLNIGMAGFSDRYLFVSKTFGASPGKILRYFLTESLVVLIVSVALSLVVTSFANTFIQRYFALDLFVGNWPWVVGIILLFSLLVVLSGMLPVLRYVFRYMKTFSGSRMQEKPHTRGLSKPLLVLQYTITIALIIAVVVIHKQAGYALENSMGSGSQNLICMEKVHSQVQRKFKLFKSEVLKYQSIESVSAMMENPGGEINDKMQFEMEGFQPDESDDLADWIAVLPCDYSFASVFDLHFLAGENFSQSNHDHEGMGEYIINESAMQKLNYSNPSQIIAKEFKLNFAHGKINIPKGKIIGVVEDFHFSSMKRKIQPLVLFKREAMWLMNFIIAHKPGMRKQALADIKKVWNNLYPEYPFQYQFVSSMYRSVYETEIVQARLLSLFTLVSLFICSMGLLGMSLLLSQRRSKEIGIRKVNGARSRQILGMLNWHLLRWLLLSFALAIPLALFAMNQWLKNFAYKTTLSWWIFAVAGLIAVLISFVAISVNSWKAASTNPVNVLRDE